MTTDFDRLGLNELIELRQQLERTVRERFERRLALMCTDVVGSTAFFHQFGDVTGRGLQQRHFSQLDSALGLGGGKLFNTAGDGAFSYFERAEGAVAAAKALLRSIQTENRSMPETERLGVRVGIHFGPVLQDGDTVAGDAVNLCARVAGLADRQHIVLTRETFNELGSESRSRCRRFESATVKGIPDPVEYTSFEWLERASLPGLVRVEETEETFVLDADRDIVSFGRLSAQGNKSGNDVVLAHPDPEETLKISRYHFELRRDEAGCRIRSLTDKHIEVDGVRLRQDEEAAVTGASVVRVARLLTLRFETTPRDDTAIDPGAGGETVAVPDTNVSDR